MDFEKDIEENPDMLLMDGNPIYDDVAYSQEYMNAVMQHQMNMNYGEDYQYLMTQE
jgi:hypothetical protein